MKLFYLVFTLINARPIANPDLRQILLAHTVPSENAKVHSPAGLADTALFQASHNPTAPNPPNSLAAAGGGGLLAGLGGGNGGLLGGLLGGLGGGAAPAPAGNEDGNGNPPAPAAPAAAGL